MFETIQTQLSGQIYYKNTALDQAVRNVYATDASEYQEKPVAVVLPRTIDDIKILIDFATQQKLTLIPRAAGTSLAGQVVGNGIVVDISKHFNQIVELNVAEKWVRVQPGVIRDDLNAFLKPHGLMFGPETSTANRAMIGGMIGNNSCGLHSIVWGTTRDNLLEVKALLSDGSEAVFNDLTQTQYVEKCTLNNTEGTIYRKIKALIDNSDNQKAIEKGFPKKNIKRRNTGYALDFVCDMAKFEDNKPFNLSKLIAGSEGTLCFITEAKLQLIDLPPKVVGMVAIHAATINDALQANLVALAHQCAASELVDDFILQFTKTNIEQSKNRFFIEGEPKAILMVEFFADNETDFKAKCTHLIADLKDKKLGYAYPVLSGEDSKKAWEVRKGGLGLLRNLKGDAKPVNLIEDCAVEPADLPEYIEKLEKILRGYDLQYSMYAHAGAGELHVEPIINLKTKDGLFLFRTVLEDTAALVKSFGGSLSGEHGDGRLRGEFIPFMMGEKNYALFKQVKAIFDPLSIFNRGKIVDTPPMDKFLRYATETPKKQLKTVYNFNNQEGFFRLAEKCSGSGDCRKTEISGGTMCPSYMATRSERDTTRARANILRQYLTNEDTNFVSDTEVKEILDLCLSCKACKSECPSSVDVAKMKGEFMQSYYDKHSVPFRTKLIGNFSKQMKLATLAPWGYNLIFNTPTLRKLANRIVGFHPDRTMPHLASQTLRGWYQKNFKTTAASASKRVYIFCDEFTNYNDVEIGKKLLLLLQKLGYNPVILNHEESGRTYLSKGLIRDAQQIAIKNVQFFKDKITAETPLIGIEPSAILTFRDEYLELVPDELLPDAQKIAQNSLLFEEWFLQEIEKGVIQKAAFTEQEQAIKLHGHCHQKALTALNIAQKALSFPKNYVVETINSGCCGMAGSFGYEKEHYEVSMKIGELVLFPTVRAASESSIIAASGTSCRHQIKDGTDKNAQHAIEILFNALKNS
ncbi:MAG: FAD-linked oxidase C-terminal domain-containing protein [Saprospiraceae bacterium]|nr:FAD-linked oxidase C-terminal domain-containing protein [Saprospiraceae bacterium]